MLCSESIRRFHGQVPGRAKLAPSRNDNQPRRRRDRVSLPPFAEGVGHFVVVDQPAIVGSMQGDCELANHLIVGQFPACVAAFDSAGEERVGRRRTGQRAVRISKSRPTCALRT